MKDSDVRQNGNNSKEETKKSWNRLQKGFDDVPDPVLLIGLDYRVRMMNKAARSAYLRDDDQASSQHCYCYKLFYNRDRPCSGMEKPCTLTMINKNRTPVKVVHKHVRSDGTRRYVDILAAPRLGFKGKLNGIIVMCRDITHQKMNEKALKELCRIINLSPAVVFRWGSGSDWPVEFVSNNVEKVFGWSAREFVSGSVSYAKVIHPDDLERVKREVARHSKAKEREHFAHVPYRVITKSGEIKWLDDRTFISRKKNGIINHFHGIVMDVTDLVEAEEELRKALYEKEVLLNELHHRVKNNMMLISSMLEMQAENIGSSELKTILAEHLGRIKVMSMVHESLYQSGSFKNFEINRDFIGALLEYLARMFSLHEKSITFNYDTDGMKLNFDCCVPIGLIINELVTNAVKHAFPDGRQGEVQVKMSLIGAGKCQLKVVDNGVGLPPDFDMENPKGFGMRMLTGMIRHQLNGSIKATVGNGTSFVVRFPLKKNKRLQDVA